MVLICLICPLVMLFPKPLILRAEANKTRGYGAIGGEDEAEFIDNSSHGGHGHGDGDF